MHRSYLAIDLGAESGRGILAQRAGPKIQIRELHRFANAPVRLHTGFYWDALRLFHEICESIRTARSMSDHLDGIGIDTWGVDFGLIGCDGSLIENPRHYRDERTRGIPQEVFDTVPRHEIFRQTGVQFMDINSLYQLYAFHKNAPHLLRLVSKLLFMPDVFNYFLTGVLASEPTIASTSQFYDPINKCFAIDLLRRIGIDPGILPELRRVGAELGPLLPYVARSSGLDREAMVYSTASHDTAAAVAATPALSTRNWCYISSGTWSLMGMETKEPVINQDSLQANFTNEVGVAGTTRFLKNIPGLWVLQECRRAWASEGQEYSYAELIERAAAARPLPTLLDLDEFTVPGDYPKRISEYCRKTGQEAPGDVGSTSRVILQSLAARYNEVLDSLERLTRRPIDVIHIVGGGSHNKLLNQLTADVTGRPVMAGPAEATAIGNALTQALGAGEVSSLEEMRDVVRQSFDIEEFWPRL